MKLLLKHLKKKKEGEKLKLPHAVEKQKQIPGTDNDGIVDSYAEVSMPNLISTVHALVKTCDSLRVNHQALLDYLQEMKGLSGVEDVFKIGKGIRQKEAADQEVEKPKSKLKLKLPKRLKLKR